MSNTTVTPSQEALWREELMLTGAFAAQPPVKNYFVEAGAGAGKTYILVHRIANQLEYGVYTPQDIVAITFTKKATQEMSGRLAGEMEARYRKATDPVKKAHLKNLVDQMGQMQISTIHGFCQSMLTAMPFDTDLGVKWEVEESEENAITAHFNRFYGQNPDQFKIIDQLCIQRKGLLKFFERLCTVHYDEVAYLSPSDSAMVALRQEMVDIGHSQFQVLKKRFDAILKTDDRYLLSGDFIRLLGQASLTDDEALHLTAQTKDDVKVFLAPYSKATEELREWLAAKPNKAQVQQAADDGLPLYVAMWETQHETEVNPLKPLLKNKFRTYLHGVAMELLLPVVEAYKAEKGAGDKVYYNDLLRCSSEMLKNSQTARDYFSQRYRTIYVDEFQDTDPLQAEILLHLTKQADGKLRAGSLFLVGDPKQAIYRFRGADISIYNEIKEIFLKEATVMQLADNRRSDKTICDYVDEKFTDELQASKYQAGYQSMVSVKGDTGCGCVLSYEALGVGDERKEKDPVQVAAFIQSMVNNKVPVEKNGDNGTMRPAEYGDFLILPSNKERVDDYERELTKLGIPTATTGAKSYLDVDVVAKGLALLKSLANPYHENHFLQVLTFCYGVELSTIYRYLSLCQPARMYKLRDVEASQEVLSALGDSEEDNAVAKLCVVVAELRQLYTRSRAMPPMAVAELVFEGGYNLWQPEIDQFKQKHYALVQQFCNGLRKSEAGSLQKLYREAVKCSEKQVEYQLTLRPEENCVRIMNLHKSKGLEGTVVILPFNGSKSPQAESYMDRGAKRTLHQCLMTLRGKGKSIAGAPAGWEGTGGRGKKAIPGTGDEEKNFLKAERQRLIYVAATRAKSMLVFCQSSKSLWSPLCNEDLRKPAAGATAGQPTPLEIAYKALTSGNSVPVVDVATSTQSVTLVDTDKLVEIVGQGTRYAITPSRLDDGVKQRKEKDDHDPSGAVDDSEIDDTPGKKVAYEAPYGPDWGTIVHRVMELAVDSQDYSDGAMKAYSDQAVWETLDQVALSKTKTEMLYGRGIAPDNKWLADKVFQATAFARDDASPFRQLVDQGTRFPELSFFTSCQQGELYDHLGKFINDSDAQGKTLDVQGFIDLAVATAEGWVILDYKTNQKPADMPLKQFETQLHDHYYGQLVAYGKLLAQATGQKVKGLWLCAIHQDGTLVELKADPKG